MGATLSLVSAQQRTPSRAFVVVPWVIETGLEEGAKSSKPKK